MVEHGVQIHILPPFIWNPLFAILFHPFIHKLLFIKWHQVITPLTQFHAHTGLAYVHIRLIYQSHMSRSRSKPFQQPISKYNRIQCYHRSIQSIDSIPCLPNKFSIKFINKCNSNININSQHCYISIHYVATLRVYITLIIFC